MMRAAIGEASEAALWVMGGRFLVAASNVAARSEEEHARDRSV